MWVHTQTHSQNDVTALHSLLLTRTSNSLTETSF